MKIVLVGANGQVGRELVVTMPPGVDLVAHSRETLDIRDGAKVASVIAEEQADVVINAAAYTAVDRAESEASLAFAVNETGPANLARAVACGSGRLIHISTDFVFDGEGSAPYLPQAPLAGLGVYGRSKLAGENRVRELAGDQAVVLRTAWVYSRFGRNFVKTMLRLMAQKSSISVVADQRGTPTWARGLAQAIWRLAERPELSGNWHWTDSGETSWHEFARAIAERALSHGLLDRAVEIVPVSGDDFPTAATRPRYSVLDTRDTTAALELTPLPWRSQLGDMLGELQRKGGEYLD